jgi:hypothetical protein
MSESKPAAGPSGADPAQQARDDRAARDARERLARLWQRDLDEAEREEAPPEYELLEGWIDGTLDEVDREVFESRLQDDAELRAEVEELQCLRDEMAPSSPSVVPFVAVAATRRAAAWRFWVPLAAAAGVAGAVWLWQARPEPPITTARVSPPPDAGGPASATPGPSLAIQDEVPIVASIRDGGALVSLAADGSLSGLAGLPPELGDAVTSALGEGTLPRPDGVDLLRPAESPLMGDAPGAPDGFAVVSPVGSVVRSDRPTFRWTRLDGARAYEVTVATNDLEPVASSGETAATSWRPDAPLPRDRVLVWQVSAITGEGRVTVPAPPVPEARFRVISRAALDEVDRRLREARGSDLVALVVLTRAGLLDEAATRLERVEAANPGSEALARLRENLLALRRGR